MMNPLNHRWVRALAWTVVTVITLYALLCAWVNWTGARLLRDAQARLKAEGETTDFRAVTSEPVPDEQNFCAIPALKDLALQIDGSADKGEPGARRKHLEALKFPTGDKAKDKPGLERGAMFGVRVNLDAWRDWLRKAGVAKDVVNSDNVGLDVLKALSAQDAIVAELSSGLDRPEAHWTPPWKTRELPKMLFAVPLPHYGVVQGMSQPLALRAAAAARAGDAAKAHEALQIMGKLSEASLNDPFLIGLLVSATGTSSMVNATWEVCDARAGSAADFAKLESVFASLDYRRGALQAWRGELAAALDAVQFMKATPDSSLLVLSGTEDMPRGTSAIMSLVPSGVFDCNAAMIIEAEHDAVIRPLQDQGWAATIQSAAAFESRLMEERKQMYRRPFSFMALLIIPAVNSVTWRAAHTQCLVDQATIACVLERHRIEKGGYPDSINGLKLASGNPLPMDALSGKPMGYRKTDNGKYALWCVGFDGKDDGGKRVLDTKNPQTTKFSDKNYKGDWVWDFLATK